MTELTAQQDRQLQRGSCPFCNSGRFLHGPCGGCSENIRCVGCGKEFCFSAPFTSLLLDRDQPEIYRDEFSLRSEMADMKDGLDSMFGKPVPKGTFKYAHYIVLGLGFAVGILLTLMIRRSLHGF